MIEIKEVLVKVKQEFISFLPNHPEMPFAARVNFTCGMWGGYVVALYSQHLEKRCIGQFLDTAHENPDPLLALQEAYSFLQDVMEGKIHENDNRLVNNLDELGQPGEHQIFLLEKDYYAMQEGKEDTPYFQRKSGGWKLEWRTARGLQEYTFSDYRFGGPYVALLLAKACFPDIVDGKHVKWGTALPNGPDRKKVESYNFKKYSEKYIYEQGKGVTSDYNGGFTAIVGGGDTRSKFFGCKKYGGIEKTKDAAEAWRIKHGGPPVRSKE